jgi:hypothetical protein
MFTLIRACLETVSPGGMLQLFHRLRSEQRVMKAMRPRDFRGRSRLIEPTLTSPELPHVHA